jgi:hypothetical protein
MATLYPFLPEGAHFPSSNPAAFLKVNGRPVLAFDAGTDETAYWTGIAPQGLTAPYTVIVTYFMAAATSGAVRMQAALEAVTDGDSAPLPGSQTSFDTANSAGATVPATLIFDQLSITMTNADSIQAGDYFRLALNRDADQTSGTDDAAGDCYVTAVEFRDAA